MKIKITENEQGGFDFRMKERASIWAKLLGHEFEETNFYYQGCDWDCVIELIAKAMGEKW